MKVLGLLGAIDPHKIMSSKGLTTLEVDVPSSLNNEDFFPTLAINALMRILKDLSLSTFHGQIIQSITFIFTSLGMKCYLFLPQIVPPFIFLIKTCESSMRNTLFKQLSQLVQTVKQH